MGLFFGVTFFAGAAVAIVCGLLDVVWEEVPSPISKARRLHIHVVRFRYYFSFSFRHW